MLVLLIVMLVAITTYESVVSRPPLGDAMAIPTGEASPDGRG